MGFPIWKLNNWFNFIFVFAIPKYDQTKQRHPDKEVIQLTNSVWQFRVDTGPLLPLLRFHHRDFRRPLAGGGE
jgi:hypothetical protein